MAATLITHGSGRNTNVVGPTNAAITGLDTTGANLYVAICTWDPTADFPIPTDIFGNDWLAAPGGSPVVGDAVPDDGGLFVFYCESPTTGSGYEVYVDPASRNSSIAFLAFANADVPDCLDTGTINRSTSSGSPDASLQAGSITPGRGFEILVAGYQHGTLLSGGVSISGIGTNTVLDFEDFVAGQSYAVASAYEIQGSFTTRNPTWTPTIPSDMTVALVAFRGIQDTGETFITPGAGSLTIQGLDAFAGQLTPKVITPNAASLTISGAAPTSVNARFVTPTTGALALSGVASTLFSATLRTPTTGALTLLGAIAVTQGSSAITPTTGALTLSGLAPSAIVPISIAPGVGSLSASGIAPTRITNMLITPTRGVLTLSGVVPSRVLQHLRPTSAGALTLAGSAPTLRTAYLPTPAAGALTLNGNAPIVVYAHRITPAVGALTVTGHESDAFQPFTLTPAAGSLVLHSGEPFHGGYKPTWHAVKKLTRLF